MFGPYVNNGENGRLYVTVVWFAHLFEIAWSHPPQSDAFFNAHHGELIENYLFQKMGPHQYFSLNNNTSGQKKIKCENNSKWGPKRYRKTREFQIWLKNSNPITSVLPKKRRKLATYPIYFAYKRRCMLPYAMHAITRLGQWVAMNM